MRSIYFLFFSLFCTTLYAQNNAVSNVQTSQEGKNIVITYDLVSLDNMEAYYEVSMMVDGRRVTSKNNVRGDIGRVTRGGSKKIVWDVLKDRPNGIKGGKISVSADKYSPGEKKSFLMFTAYSDIGLNGISLNQDDIKQYRFMGQAVNLNMESAGLNIGFGGRFTYFLNESIGVGLDVGFKGYSTKITLDNTDIDYNNTDKDGHSYTRQISINKLEESWKVSNLNVMPQLTYLSKGDSPLQFLVTLGYQLGVSTISNTHEYSAVFTAENQYDTGWSDGAKDDDFAYILTAQDTDGNGVIQPTEVGNINYDLYTDMQKNETLNTEVNSTSGLFLSAGLLFGFNENIHLLIAPQYTLGFGNLLKNPIQEVEDNILIEQYDSYQSLMSASSQSKLSSFGLQIGLSYLLK